MKSKREFHLHDGKLGSAIAIRVTPHAKKNEITEILDDGTIKIRLKAKPIDGEANEELIKFLSDILDVPPSKIEIVAGQSGKNKLVTILSLDTAAVQERILAKVAK